MTDDEHLRDRFANLRREGARGVQPPPLERMRARARRQTVVRRAGGVAAVAVVTAAVIAGSQLTGTGSSAPSPATHVTSASTPSKPVPNTSYFGPNATSFVSAGQGWALSRGGCAGCGRLFHTTDGGRHWTTVSGSVPLPGPRSALVDGRVDMYFADPRNGYIFGTDHCASQCLAVTHDGGRTWQRTSMPAVTQLVDAGPVLYVLSKGRPPGYHAALWRSSPGADTWAPVALPTSNQLDYITADGDTVVLLRRGAYSGGATASQLGRLWVSADGGASWSARPNPCTVADGGATLVSVALGHPAALLVDCYDGEQSSQAQHTQHHLYGSADSGVHWVRLDDPTHIGEPVLLADNGAGHAFLATESGGADTFAASLDGGVHWHPAITDRSGGFFGWADLRFVSPSTGFVFGPTHFTPTHLYRTRDGGRTWQSIPLPRAGG